MRTCFLFMLVSICAYSSAQPTRKQMEQMQKEAMQQLKKMQQNRELPTNLNRNVSSASTASVSPATKPPFFQSKVISLKLELPYPASQAKDKMLWYKGRRKSDSVLVLPDGGVVKWSRKRNEVTIQPPVKRNTPFQKIADELKKTEQRKTEIINLLAKGKNGPFNYPYARQAIQNLDEIRREYDLALANTIQLPFPPKDESNTEKQLQHGPSVSANAIDVGTEEYPITAWMMGFYEDVMSYMKQRLNDNTFDVGTPPAMEFDYCLACDKDRKENYNEALASFQKNFVKEENEMEEKALAVLSQFAKSAEAEKGEDSILKTKMEADLYNALAFLNRRCCNKAWFLFHKYENDFPRLSAIVPIVIQMERRKQLFGFADESNSSFLAELINPKTFLNYINDLFKQKDYSKLLNYGWIISFIRQFQLAGSDENNGDLLADLLTRLQNFNRFELTIEPEFEYRMNDSHTIPAHLINEPYYVTAVPDDHCKFQFISKAGNMINLGEMPMVNMKILTIGNGGAKYTGTPDWYTFEPLINLSFCQDKDTISIQPFFYSLSNPKDTWKILQGDKSWSDEEGYLGQYLGLSFKYNEGPERSDKDLPSDAEIEKMFMKSLSPVPVGANISEMERNFKLMTMAGKFIGGMQNNGVVAEAALRNKCDILFYKKINGKEDRDDDVARDIIRANMVVQLKHAPLQE